MLTKQFKRYNDMENSQLTLGYYNELPFLSMSPVFEAQKGRDLSKLPLQEGEKIFNHDNKIFFQLDLDDLIKITEGIRLIDEEGAISFSLTHRGFKGDSIKVLEMGATEETGFYLKMTHKTPESKNVIFFSFEAFLPEQGIIKVKDKHGKVVDHDLPIYASEFEEFIEKSKFVALKIMAPTDDKNNFGSDSDGDDDEMSAPFSRNKSSFKSNSKRGSGLNKPRSFSRRGTSDKEEETTLPPRKTTAVSDASAVFDDED